VIVISHMTSLNKMDDKALADIKRVFSFELGSSFQTFAPQVNP